MSVAYTDLESDMDEYATADVAEVRTLTTIEEAAQALRIIRAIDRDVARFQRLAKLEVERATEWLRERTLPMLDRREHFARLAEGWMRAHHDETGTKTQHLPAGSLKLTAARTSIRPTTAEVPDEWARVKREWDKTKVAKATMPGPVVEMEDCPAGHTAHAAITETGEIIPGVVVLMADQPTFSVVVS